MIFFIAGNLCSVLYIRITKLRNKTGEIINLQNGKQRKLKALILFFFCLKGRQVK